MIASISTAHQQRLEEIRKDLQSLGCKESQFLKIELLFFEVLAISRTYGNDLEQNKLLAELKIVQHDQYEKTKVLTKKAGQRELSIRRFVISLRKVLSGIN
jgi:ABC-type transport system involved in cytochrome c biogenesis ATPase subunit